MEWLGTIKEAIKYMEDNLTEIQSPEEVADHVHMSSMYLQKGFQIMTGYTLGEYMRNRKMYLSAMELATWKEKVIDIALKYGYETPESFSKAFSRFHGCTPREIAANKALIKAFHPLTVTLLIQGGDKMEYSVEKMNSFKVIGFARDFSGETSMREIPRFWEEILVAYGLKVMRGEEPSNDIEKAFAMNRVGEYGVCIENLGAPGTFRYVIAGKYMGGDVPEGMEVFEVPETLWVKFKCIGAIPDALQSMTRQIWTEWLPGNREYELDGDISIEWYSPIGIPSDADYRTGIWLPVKKA